MEKVGWAAILEEEAVLGALTAWECYKGPLGKEIEQLIHTVFERMWERQGTVKTGVL